jgi:outer membrane protein TolC
MLMGQFMKSPIFVLGMAVGFVWSLAASEPWTLDQAIRCALTNSPDARLAWQRIAAAQAVLNQARSAFSSQLQFQSSYTRTDNPMLVLP